MAMAMTRSLTVCPQFSLIVRVLTKFDGGIISHFRFRLLKPISGPGQLFFSSENCRRNYSSSPQPSIPSANAKIVASEQSEEHDSGVKTELNSELIRHLERTSLVDFESEEALVRLQEAIQFADTILHVDTTGVEPMASVLEDRSLRLREDKAVKTSRKAILSNAMITEEDYFVSPPGNIPLEPKNKNFGKTSSVKS